MGLASYGNRHAFDFSWLIDFKDGELRLNEPFVDQFSKLLHQAMTTSKGNLLGAKSVT